MAANSKTKAKTDIPDLNIFEKIKNFPEFYKEAKEELKKVVWPEKKVVINATWVVILIVIIVSSVLGIVDLIYTNIIKAIFG